MIKERVFWHDTIDMPAETGLTPIPDKVDVAIIGGGYTGLSAAITLARHGTSVVVLEAETMGWGASSRNGGMVLPGLKPAMSTVIKRYGLETAQKLYQCSIDSIDAVEKIIRAENIVCGFTRTGHLVLATKPKHYDSLARNVEFMAKNFNHRLTIVPKDELSREIGSQIYFGGVVDEISAGLNPAQYVSGLARAAEKQGASLCGQARVTSLDKQAKGFRLITSRGPLTSERVIIATSGYTGVLTPKLQRKIIPLGSFIIATEPLPIELVAELSPKNRMIYDHRNFLNYFRFSVDNRLIFGGRADFFTESDSTIRKSAEILHRDMLKVYPQLRNVQVEYAWGGTIDFTFDMMPHVGEVDGVYFALGYAGHGVALATFLGETTAEAILAGRIQDHLFATMPFPGAPLGLYNGNPWFLPFAGLWYRILDILE
jgi:glycine/D-amino acid oxidase-like deaminating enzyme